MKKCARVATSESPSCRLSPPSAGACAPAPDRGIVQCASHELRRPGPGGPLAARGRLDNSLRTRDMRRRSLSSESFLRDLPYFFFSTDCGTSHTGAAHRTADVAMASPPGSPGQTGWAELKSLRDSATFISEDILNYEPPSERRARLRARNDSQNSADNSVELSSSASNLQSSCSLEPGPGTPPFAKENAPESLPVASAESPEGAREGEFSATPSLYTWHLKCDVPAPNAAFRLTISGRSMVVTVGSTTQLGPDSVALLARRLVLPLDADLSELVASFHEGEVKIQIVRKGGGKSAQLSPGPVDTLALARNTEEMMAELSDMLELGFQQPAPAYGDDSAPARPLSDSALMRSPQKTTASELPRDDVMPPMSAERMPTIQSIDPDATAHSAIQSISLDNPHGKASDARFTMRHEPAAPHASVAPSKVPSAQRSGAPHASLTPQQVAPDFANQFTSPTATPSDQDKAVRAAQRRDQFLHSVDRDSAPTASHAEPNAAAEPAAPLSQSTGRNLNLKPQAPESDVLKRCQVNCPARQLRVCRIQIELQALSRPRRVNPASTDILACRIS